ncbi:MAG: hypothetical protein R3E98_08210 [Gemmatimonadota bacterium]|nr:hypothetical protein [Gemmatimonadota bacterium]
MDLNALGNLGEFIGAIGVIVSLIYVSVQLKQNTKAVRASSYQEISHNSLELLSLIISDPDMADIWGRGLDHGAEALDPVEHFRWHSMLLATFRHWDNLYYQYRNGMLEKELWKSYRFMIRSYLVRPGFRDWWLQHQDAFSESLQQLMRGWINTLDHAATREMSFHPAAEDE